MSTFAKNTQVSSDKSRSEIEKILSMYGADQFIYGSQVGKAMIGFRFNKIMVKFILLLPSKKEFEETDTGKARCASQIEKCYEQAVRQKWRALALVVKAKLESIESGIATFEEEFLAHIVLPNGRLVKDEVLPKIELAYSSGKQPKLLPQF